MLWQFSLLAAGQQENFVLITVSLISISYNFRCFFPLTLPLKLIFSPQFSCSAKQKTIVWTKRNSWHWRKSLVTSKKLLQSYRILAIQPLDLEAQRLLTKAPPRHASMLCTKCEGSVNSIALTSLDLRDWLLSGDESQQSILSVRDGTNSNQYEFE